MNPAGQTICLSMIVKNEASVIRRCLASVRPLIDHWVIVDTGSNDGTQDVVRECFGDIPGELYERPWQDFAHNRSEALDLARSCADYTLIIDADDVMRIPDGFVMPELTADSYSVEIQDTTIRYQRTQLVRNALPWRYRGVLHEFLTCDGSGPSGHLSLTMLRNHDGARRKDPTTYQKDAAVLEQALQTETDPFLRSRYTFYLAQSYRDCAQKDKALKYYLERAELGFWDQERFISLYHAAQLKMDLGYPDQDVVDTYLAASTVAPMRAEALHGASQFCRVKGRHKEGYELAARGIMLQLPANGLFVEPWIYEYGLLDEFSVHAYWTEQYEECLDVCRRLLNENLIPQSQRARVQQNADFAASKLELSRKLVVGDSQETVSGQHLCDKDNIEAGKFTIQVYTKQFRIFRTIHIVWVGDESLRPDACIETWREMNPAWTVRVWGNQELRSESWRNARHIRSMVTRELCGVADMMRWEILDRVGGFAIDADSICIRPLEDWLFESEIFACWENEIKRPGLIANGYVYSHPANSLVRQIIGDIHALPDVNGKYAWQLTGPQRLTDTLHQTGYRGLTIYPSHFFMPEHLTGFSYDGSGPVFARQYWGRARPHMYQTIANKLLLAEDVSKSEKSIF